MSAFFSFLYKFTRYLLKKLQNLKKFPLISGIFGVDGNVTTGMSEDQEVFVAALLSSLALFLADKKDLHLLKLLIYPRALEALYALLVEKGIVKPIRYGENLLIVSAVTIVTYFFIHEANILEPSTKKSIDNYMNLISSEKNLANTYRMMQTNEIRYAYPNN